MFRQVLTKTPLVNEIANDYFTNIRGKDYQGDVSFVSTLRALVAPRMSDDDSITVWFSCSNHAKDRIESNSVRNLLDSVGTDLDYLHTGDIYIHNLTRNSEDNAVMIQKVKEKLTKEFPAWKAIEKVETFFRKAFSVCCFINPEKKNVILFVDSMDIRKYHYLQCGILAFLPWYFDPEKGVSEQEMELIKSLREKTSEKYERCIAEIASKYNFRELRIKKLLTGFETKYEEAEVRQVENTIGDLIRKINDYNDIIGDYLRQKADYEIRRAGLQKKIAEGSEDSEIMDYFLCNKNLVLESISDTTMTFSTIGYVTYFDEDEAENVIDNPDSYIYKPNGRGCNNIIPSEDMEMLMKAIFIDQTLKMRFCSSYTFNLRENVRANRDHDYSAIEFRDCTPNTHIDRYSCMGNYERVINEMLMEHNYIGAIEQCMASTVSLNFSDGCVMEEFMRRMYGISDYSVNIRCIELPDGKVVEPKEAIEYLKSQNTQEGEENG
jgi:hypothetical protein